MKQYKNYILPAVVLIIVTLFIAVSFFDVFYRAKEKSGMIIAQDVSQLRDIFHRIHNTCGIIDFDYQKSPINFLNVKEFTGSEVGPMNLVYPDKWQGPYLEDNPTMQAIEYQIVVTDKGYFITPGDGVKLPNGKIVGEDIILNKDADIPELTRDPQGLLYKDRALAVQLDLGAPAAVRLYLGEGD